MQTLLKLRFLFSVFFLSSEAHSESYFEHNNKNIIKFVYNIYDYLKMFIESILVMMVSDLIQAFVRTENWQSKIS